MTVSAGQARGPRCRDARLNPASTGYPAVPAAAVVVGGAVVGGCVVGGCVVGGVVVVVGSAVVGGDVVCPGDFVEVGDFAGVGDLVGVGDFEGVADFEGKVVPVAATTMPLPGVPPTGCVTLACAPGLWLADCDWVWVGIVTLPPTFRKFVLPLLEISTAIIATAPMAAAPVPAIKKVRFPGLRETGSRSGAP